MTRALIGHTGFVGGTLLRSGWGFDETFNSSNIADISGRAFDTVVCAGVSAVKWQANREPEADWRGIQTLIDALDGVKAGRFVLISTTDVYQGPLGVDENDPAPIDGPEAYGRHRLALERWIAERFPVHNVVRLPALFGAGLKKNAIFDLLTGNQVEKINPNGEFQWYPVRRLARDLRAIVDAEVGLINIAAEPMRTADFAMRLFPEARIGSPDLPLVRYDMQTIHASLLGGSGRYHFAAEAVMGEIATYVADVRANGGTP